MNDLKLYLFGRNVDLQFETEFSWCPKRADDSGACVRQESNKCIEVRYCAADVVGQHVEDPIIYCLVPASYRA